MGASMKTDDVFPSEGAMQTSLRKASVSIYCQAGEPWVILDEHQIHSRIPDLVLARIDTEALAERINGGWGRALSPTELRALRALRPDRGRSLASAAEEMRVGPERARETLHRLVVDTFVERTPSGSMPALPLFARLLIASSRLRPSAAISGAPLARPVLTAPAPTLASWRSTWSTADGQRNAVTSIRRRRLVYSASQPPMDHGSTSSRGAVAAWSRP
jgi:hypothetical protein